MSSRLFPGLLASCSADRFVEGHSTDFNASSMSTVSSWRYTIQPSTDSATATTMAGGRQCDPADGGVEHDFVGWHFSDDVSVQPFAEAVSGEYAQQ